jgi:hypothetical protein
MQIPKIDGLDLDSVVFDDELYNDHLTIDFESSKQSVWIPFNADNPNKTFKAVINLSLVLGYKWQDIGIESLEDSELSNWLESINSDDDIDNEVAESLEYLNEWAYETDPGWIFLLDLEGLKMSSIWTEDSDIWDGESRTEILFPEVITPKELR